MARLLYIESSPRKDRSASIDIARSFIDEYRTNHPDDSITVLDLWKTDLPSFDGDTINAKYAILHGEEHSESQKTAWSDVEKIISDFTSADKYLISLPMWNFGIPYVLKHYIDILVQPSYTFSFSPDSGYSGLITGKPAAIVYARGGAYDTGSDTANLDFQKSYMELVLSFIGITDIKSIIAEPMLMSSPEDKAMLIQQAKDAAKNIALTF